MTRYRIVFVLAASAAIVAAAAAQQPATAPAFEVASVRLSTDTRGPNVISPTRVDYIYAPLPYLIQQAYRVPPVRYAGPDGLNQVRVDIRALPPAGSTRAHIPEMLKALLAERFGLVAHFEQRLLEVTVLEIGSAGVKMREVEALDEMTRKYTADSRLGGAAVDYVSETLEGRRRTMLTMEGELIGMRTTTERTLYEDLSGPNQKRELNAVRITMAEFASMLNSAVGESVVDRTGLTGLYQFRIALPPPPQGVVSSLRRMGITTNAAGEPLEDLPSGVSAHKSVETLGLKLEKRRIPLDVLVVDKIERTPKE